MELRKDDFFLWWLRLPEVGIHQNHWDLGTLMNSRRFAEGESKPCPPRTCCGPAPRGGGPASLELRANGLGSRRRAPEGVRRGAWGARQGRGVASAAGAVVAVAAGAAAAAAGAGVLGPAVGDGGGELQPAEGAAAVSVGARDGAPR